MSTLFDSNVYQRRNATPWATINLGSFMKDMAVEGGSPVTFSCQYRPDVASRLWYTITWTDENGEEHTQSAQDPDLCLWRAAQVELQVRAKLKGKDGNDQS